MDAKTQRLLLYAALIALAWYASRNGRPGSGTVRAIDTLSGQPITPTEYYIPPAPMIPNPLTGGGGFGRF